MTNPQMLQSNKDNPDETALQYFGKAYLKTPRVMLDLLFSQSKNESMIARLHWLLFYRCNYSDGYMRVNGQQVLCCKGECIISYAKLGWLLGVNSRTVRRYVETLESKQLVEVRQIAGRVCIRVCGYASFTEQDYQADRTGVKGNVPKSRKQQDLDYQASRKAELENLMNHGSVPRFDLLEGL